MEPEITQKPDADLERTKSLPIEKNEELVITVRSVIIFLLATLSTAGLLELLPAKWNFSTLSSPNVPVNITHSNDQPTFAIYGKSPTEEHLVHVLNVLQRFGYRRIESIESDWDLLWAHDYPFLSMPQRMKQLQQHQVVNHFPGCGFLTNKVDLSTTALPFLPKAFRLPAQREDFVNYAHNNPNSLFVEKHNEHRHIFIREPAKVNLNSSDSFVQEFIQNPFLVDGYKFDIGVYVLITSLDPLLVYIYAGDVLFRYCPVKYHPFDAANVDKYVVGDDYLPTWSVPSLRKYYNRFAGSMRAAFDAYVRDQSMDPSKIWTQVEDIVRQTVLAKEEDMTRILRSYKTRNFFELMRFDLIIDDQLRVHLMEANMSPNLSSAHFKPNALLYEQILYSALNLVGVGSPVHRNSFKDSSDDVNEMITSEKNLAVNINHCAAYDCDKSCNIDECNLCLPCISGSEYNLLEMAHRQHLHKTNMKRIFPKPIINPENFDLEAEVQNMTKRNVWLTRWFFGKCEYDRSWC